MKLIENMSNAEYHSHEAVSKSQLDLISRSPSHYKYHIDGGRKTETEAMIFGSAFHDYILLPEVFEKTYTTLPDDFNGRTKDGKALVQSIKDSGKVVLKSEQMEAIASMAEQVKAHSIASSLLSSGKPEQSIFWTDSETGINCRCRPDFMNDNGIIVDLKTTDNASPESFAKSCANFRYHVQDAFYSEGVYQATGQWPKGFVFIAVEKTAPYSVACYTLNSDAKELGRELFQRDLSTLKECKEFLVYPSYSRLIEELSLPSWAFK